MHAHTANALTAPLLSQGFLLLIRVLRGNTTSAPPPAISPLTTRSGRKRKQSIMEPSPLEHGDLNVSLVTDWLASALTDFVTKKWVTYSWKLCVFKEYHNYGDTCLYRNSNVNPVFFSTYIERYPVSVLWHEDRERVLAFMYRIAGNIGGHYIWRKSHNY